jgi:menaquinone-dependent protoporphyrinogen oxidase
MTSILIVHASRHGGTAGIAERIGETLRGDGIEASVASAAEMRDPAAFDACVIGGGVYMGSWVNEGTGYLERYASTLALCPVWLFSSGPLPSPAGSKKQQPSDPIEAALGPLTGPGSGGRRKLEELATRIHPREHRVFAGAFDPTDPAKSMPERFVRIIPSFKSILPPGDYRDWPAIDAWAHEIAAALTPATVGR